MDSNILKLCDKIEKLYFAGASFYDAVKVIKDENLQIGGVLICK